MTHRKDFNDIWFTAVAEVHENGYSVDYKIHNIFGFDSVDMTNPCWMPDGVEKLEEAEVFAHGNVKWDGCSNWHFDEQDRVMIHGCSRGNLTAIGEVLARCWDWTRELIPATWDKSLNKEMPT